MPASLPILLLLLVAATDPSSVVDGVFHRQAQRDERIASATYRARTTYVETDLRSGDVKRIECERVVTRPRFGDQTQDFGEIRLGGELLEGEDREEQIEFLHSRGVVARDTRMPFFPETREDYEYEVSGPQDWRGMTVWTVRFSPVRSTDEHVSGTARVLDGSFEVVSLEFTPCDLPFVVESATMTLDYEPVDGEWLPVRFDADMDLRLSIVVEVMRRHISIEEHYSDYAFTSTAPDRTGEGD